MQFINLAHAILSSIIYNMLSYGLPPVNVQMLTEKKARKKKRKKKEEEEEEEERGRRKKERKKVFGGVFP